MAQTAVFFCKGSVINAISTSIVVACSLVIDSYFLELIIVGCPKNLFQFNVC
ncbi:hypothetical protein RAT170B_0675 [Rickettsia argasii T170-B]|uniref:Uncharacterized protein n=1 Tax=Rickettsia argasii T170-B TaxID=1268837 RepID=A0A0F3RIF3_9RICK|nr:hypothetical protein RAT170B_0675 [Rickettsia argasii T170-B]